MQKANLITLLEKKILEKVLFLEKKSVFLENFPWTRKMQFSKLCGKTFAMKPKNSCSSKLTK